VPGGSAASPAFGASTGSHCWALAGGGGGGTGVGVAPANAIPAPPNVAVASSAPAAEMNLRWEILMVCVPSITVSPCWLMTSPCPSRAVFLLNDAEEHGVQAREWPRRLK